MGDSKGSQFRGGVSHKRDAVWEYRRKKDAYTGISSLAKIENPQVDHVIECQVRLLIMLFSLPSQRSLSFLLTLGAISSGFTGPRLCVG